MRVKVPAFAKLNLDLRVLHKRPDGYHELRTIFQTISLKDTLTIEFERARQTELTLDSAIEIPDNLVLRAARAVLNELKISARIHFRLEKRIPMGAGLGGGSSDAASVLLALPALAGKQIEIGELSRIAASLGSDVPFFLYGGTALGLGRGTELYPLPDLPPLSAVVVATGVHVSTAEAYRALNRPVRGDVSTKVTTALTSADELRILGEFQTIAWEVGCARPGQLAFRNDFEAPVFINHPGLALLVKKLRRLGAEPARMTGSGSAIFGMFSSQKKAQSAALRLGTEIASPVRFLPRAQYLAIWQRALGMTAAPRRSAR